MSFLKIVHVVSLAEFHVRDIVTNETLAVLKTYEEAKAFSRTAQDKIMRAQTLFKFLRIKAA